MFNGKTTTISMVIFHSFVKSPEGKWNEVILVFSMFLTPDFCFENERSEALNRRGSRDGLGVLTWQGIEAPQTVLKWFDPSGFSSIYLSIYLSMYLYEHISTWNSILSCEGLAPLGKSPGSPGQKTSYDGCTTLGLSRSPGLPSPSPPGCLVDSVQPAGRGSSPVLGNGHLVSFVECCRMWKQL